MRALAEIVLEKRNMPSGTRWVTIRGAKVLVRGSSGIPVGGGAAAKGISKHRSKIATLKRPALVQALKTPKAPEVSRPITASKSKSEQERDSKYLDKVESWVKGNANLKSYKRGVHHYTSGPYHEMRALESGKTPGYPIPLNATKSERDKFIKKRNSKLQKRIEEANEFLGKAPKYSGEVYRGLQNIPGKSPITFKEGSIVSNSAMSSWSLSPESPKGWAREGGVILRMKATGKAGVGIPRERSWAKHHKREQEVLFSKKVKFKVSKVREEDGFTVVDVEEI